MKQAFGWSLPDDDTHFEYYFNKQGHGDYQKKQRDKALSYVEKFDFALDIGGHIGLWSRPLTEKFDRVVAFEPYLPYIDLFTLNAPKAEIIKVALGELDGSARIIAPPANSGAAYLSDAAYLENSTGCEEGNRVHIVTLDSFGYDNVDFIKIDCEGYEFPIVLGAAETLKRCNPVVIVEQKQHKTHDNWWGKTAAVEFMINILDYRVVSRVLNDWVLKKL